MIYNIPKSPRELGLPYDNWQPYQLEAIEFALTGFEQYNLVVLDMPVGSGKSLVAQAITKIMGLRNILNTSTKALQDQYGKDYPGSFIIKGANNYPCDALNKREFPIDVINTFHHDRRFKATADQGPCHVGYDCFRKTAGTCEYMKLMQESRYKHQIITNYSLHGTGVFAKTKLLICDEAHNLQKEIDNMARISHPDMPMTSLKEAKKWAVYKIKQIETFETPNVQQKREIEALTRLINIMDDASWVISGSEGDYGWYPIKCTTEGTKLAESADKILLMSATITRADVDDFISITSGVIKDYAFFSAPSTFAVEHRPVIITPARYFGHDITCGFTNTPQQTRAIHDHIIKLIRGEKPWERKGIIHTISYPRARSIVASLNAAGFGSYIFFPKFARDLNKTIEAFKKSKSGGILVSPSVTTGFDFPGDYCLWQVVMKVPYPDITNALIKKRMELNKEYPSMLAAKTLMQMSGRGVRSATDKCTTYITDNSMMTMLRKPHLFSKWFLDACKKI